MSDVRFEEMLINNLKEELKELKQQLAEYVKINDVLHSGLSERCTKCEEEHDQDKISFALEQLEKVKEFVNETSGIVGHEWRIDRFRVLEHIDDQIKQLKEGK